MDLDTGIFGLQLPLVRFQVVGVEIADVNGFSAILCEMMRGCTPDSERGVAAGDDDDFAFDATEEQ